MFNLPKLWVSYGIGLFLLFLGVLLSGTHLGGAIAVLGFLVCFANSLYFSKKSLGIKWNIYSVLNNKTYRQLTQKNIRTEGGTYNENIQGDSINIQGITIYVGQDLSDFSAQIRDLCHRLEEREIDPETAEEKVTQELKSQISQNPKIRTKILRWKKALGILSSEQPNDTELAERVIEFSTDNSLQMGGDSIFVFEGKYKQLYDLLEAQKWREADHETARIMYDLMPDFKYILDIDQVPPKDLRNINKLWVNFSHGRFGLSVQKNIWLKIVQAYDSNENTIFKSKNWSSHYTGMIDDSIFYAFIDRVGWSREQSRIYYTDLEYSLKAPRGHFPARLMFVASSSYYSKPSNYCYLNKSICYELMNREYYRIPFIPPWLENWLPLE